MAQNPLNNMQASLALTQYFPLAGVFPSNGGSSTDFFLGEIGTFAGTFAPAGGTASGQLLSIAQNTAVFSLLGNTYGGNGQTTFALPNLNGTTMVGTGQGLGLDAETLGEQTGSTTVTLSYGQTPANGLNPFGQSQSFDNHQPSLGITYEIATKGVFPSQGGGSNPLNTLGMIMAFAGNFEAGGYMICDGRLLSIAQNTALFSVLGTTYGGNGTTTFALPDLRGRAIIGASAADPVGSMVGQEEVTLTPSEVPNIPNSPAPAAFDNRQPSLAMEYLIAVQGIFPSQGGSQNSQTPFLGQIVSFAGNFVPSGWALCNGGLMSIAQNTALFSVLGTTYGGNGTTTFALPDLRGKTVIGTSAGITLGTTVGANGTTVTTAELPFPMPRFSGAAVTVGQFGAWTPVDSVQSGGGYEIVWKNGNANQFIVWTTDNNGNFQSQGPVLSGVTYALQSLEPTFGQDLNGDGTVGLVVTTIEAFGGTDLKQVADTYFLYDHGTSTGPQLMMSNAAVTVGQFGSWTAIGAEKSPFGNYLVVWKNGGADQYVVWSVDNAGNWIGQGDVVSGASSQLQVLEPGFNQDLGGGGIAARAVIESAGTTTLAMIANTWVLSPTSSALGVQLKMSGAPVTVGQFGNWTAIGAERGWNGNFLTVWKNGNLDEYIVWTVDGGGSWVSQSALLSGASTTIQALEPGFNQDLGGGGIATRTVIEAFGTTALARIANTYVVSPTGNALGPQIKMSGAAVTLGQFGNWTPLGAERVGDGTYQVAWKNGGLDQYLAWNIDSNGNYLSQGTVVSGGSWYTQNFENLLQQDLNGDGTTGFVTANIETIGGTALTKVADSYYFNYGSGGPQLKMNGTYVAQGQFGSWTPLGVEQAANGTYELAWKNGGADQYIVWETDSAGNFLRFMNDPSSGSTSAVQQFEPFLQQDLNGDGVIPIEAFGATKLVQVANNYRLDPMAVLGGPLLKDNNAIVTLNQYGAWTPIAAEQTATGFGVAWKNGNADQYLVWNLDASANKLAQTGVMSGADASLKAFEASFQQDLNKDGVIGAPSATPDMALFTSYMASAFATPAGEGTGIVNEESSSQPILVKPLG